MAYISATVSLLIETFIFKLKLSSEYQNQVLFGTLILSIIFKVSLLVFIDDHKMTKSMF